MKNLFFCRKYLLYNVILIITFSVFQSWLVIGLFRERTTVSSAKMHVSLQILFIMVACIFTTYLVSAITRLIGQRNFFKISRKLLSVSSAVNYREGTIFSNAVIALHFVLFVILIRYSLEWIRSDCRLDLMLFFFFSYLVSYVIPLPVLQNFSSCFFSLSIVILCC